MQKIFGAVVVAAGHGTFNGRAKILEEVDGIPMISRIVRAVRAVSTGTCAVVVNPRFGREVTSTLAGTNDNHCAMVVQTKRFGTAEAVERALPRLKKEGVTDFLALYADMPLWSPDTFSSLMQLHCAHDADLSMVTIALTNAHPAVVQRYGRIMRDPSGGIDRIFEVGQLQESSPFTGSVSPSLFVIKLSWFEAHSAKIPVTVHKRDGYPEERWLPSFVGITHDVGGKIADLELADANEALGVNTPHELAFVREIARQRQKNSEIQGASI